MWRDLAGLLRQARPWWPWYLLGALALIGTNTADLATTFVVKYAVNEIAGTPQSGGALAALRGLAARAGLAPLAVLALAFAGLVLVQVCFRYVWRMGFVMTSQRIAARLRADLFAHLKRQDHAWLDRASTGELLSVATSDVEAMRMFLGMGLMITVDTLLYFLLVPYVMLSTSWQLTLVLVAPLPLIPLVVSRLGNAVHRRFTACQEQIARIAGRSREGIAGMRVVQGFVQSEHEVREMEALSRESMARHVALARVQALFIPTLTSLVGLELFLVMWFGGGAVAAGRLGAGELFQMLLMTLMLTHPMMGLGWTLSLYQRGAASWGRYRALVERAPAIADDPARTDRDRVSFGRIEFQGLTFAYPAAPGPALEGVDLVVPAGATVALVGPVGAGKSTLASLVPRFYEAPRGTVRLDGAELDRFPLAVLRGAIGFVPQRTFLFSASIEENIALGLETFTREQVERAARLAGLAPDIAAFPAGYDTLLGERGVNLSGGQKQRVALARALIREPRILVLDDCLSAVDTETEERILAGLREYRAGRTTLVASHRMSAVRDADLVCVLERGRIAERGTHEELLARDGWYAATYRQQLLEARLGTGAEARPPEVLRVSGGATAPPDVPPDVPPEPGGPEEPGMYEPRDLP